MASISSTDPIRKTRCTLALQCLLLGSSTQHSAGWEWGFERAAYMLRMCTFISLPELFQVTLLHLSLLLPILPSPRNPRPQLSPRELPGSMPFLFLPQESQWQQLLRINYPQGLGSVPGAQSRYHQISLRLKKNKQQKFRDKGTCWRLHSECMIQMGFQLPSASLPNQFLFSYNMRHFHSPHDNHLDRRLNGSQPNKMSV